eukprot:TRINITY_DN96025_c0_g1_i1.p1 TRINITY_DN96025_c0_g1~~TRINITY_DN96025_c0_g1_i1.p1  ORF type:complete len:207 (-),score=37.35 TRINITY_DN96025_c0_g1_i1:399-1019(-)
MSPEPILVTVKNTFIHVELPMTTLHRCRSAPTMSNACSVTESLEASSDRAVSDRSTQEDSDIEAQNTTVMFRNIPETYTREMLVDLFDSQGFKAYYDFVYLPINFRTDLAFGYAFVNFVDNGALRKFSNHFNGYCDWGFDSDKIAEITLSCKLQGLEEHVKRYRDSPVMFRSVPDKHKPMLFFAGHRVPFPPPTKKLKAPRMRGAY